MDEECIPLQYREEEDSEEEMGEVLRDAGRSSESWATLPNVCLLHMFRFLGDRDRMSTDLVCQHWHNVMRSPSLWRSHLFHFSGHLSQFRQSEYHSAVAYVRSLGIYLERLEVCVYPPRRYLVAQKLEHTISRLFLELIRVQAPLKSLSLTNLRLDQSSWTSGLRRSLVHHLIIYLRKGGSRLTSVSLKGMRISTNQGLELLSALAHSQKRHYHRFLISSLNLKGFFPGDVPMYHNTNVPHILRHMLGLTHLTLSYSCLSDELLLAFQKRERRWSGVKPLQEVSLHCTLKEPHKQVVCGDSWATLASCCPGLKVKMTVYQIINTDRLARILLPEIPLTEFTMTAFYSPDEYWSAMPLFYRMLPPYRHSLRCLTLDFSNCSESLDEELVELVQWCDQLEQLRVWAFLDIRTAQRLLNIRLTQRSLLNKIRVRIYSLEEDTKEQEDQLEEVLSSYRHLPPELDFYAKVCPFV